MTPIEDPRPFAEVLQDWIERHGGSAYGAAKLMYTSEATVGRWLKGGPIRREQAERALMTMVDEGRV
ncbi:hypothetical protein [Haematobacter sp. UBA3484]|uniref:hypothetical protein n=1 Tax=Haematobacter sp. UBA3484 TaxID=1946582 RepID=UPI0025C1FCE8|nr:hypothetical protein [Haematobacter sp. UBA3484]